MTRSLARLQSVLKQSSTASTSTSVRAPSSITTSLASRVSFLKEALRSAPNTSYCNTSFDVPPGGKQMDKVRKVLQHFITTMSKIDDTAFMIQHNQTFTPEEGSYAFDPKLLISNEYSLLKFSTNVSFFFP